MKKNIVVAVLAFMCAAGLASCNNKEINGLKITGVDGENKQDNYNLGEYNYGETAKIKENFEGLRFFYYFHKDDGFEEAKREDIKMVYFDSNTNAPIYTMPEEFFAGSYHIYYYVDGHEPTTTHSDSFSVSVDFTVNQLSCDKANSGKFTAELSKTEWRYGALSEPEITINFKNPDGKPFTKLPDNTYPDSKKDDTGYNNVSHYYTTAQNYNSVKNLSYTAIGESDYVNMFSADENGNPEFSWLKPGNYVYFATFYESCNYKDIVTNGVPFKVSDPTSPAGKTFKLTATRAVVFSEEQNDVVDFTNEQAVAAINAYFKPNINKTVIFEQGTGANGNIAGSIKGTCDFGFGPMGELTGEDAYTWDFNADELLITFKNGRTDEYGIELRFEYRGQTSLKMYIEQVLRDTQGNPTSDFYYAEMIFEEVQA